MTSSRLSDAEIVKALKRCSDPDGVCKKCPLDKAPDCSAKLMQMAAARLVALGKQKSTSAREQELLDRVADLHREIIQYEAERDWGGEDVGEFSYLLP